jgi:hypothetical protein
MDQTSPAPNSRLSWTRSEDEKLVQLYKEHVTFSEMAAQMGRTTKSLTLRIKILSFPFQEAQPEIPFERKAFSRWSEAEQDKIVESYRQGISLAAVSLETGRTVESICLQLAHLGVAEPQDLDLVTYFAQMDRPANGGLRWTEIELEQLLGKFLGGASLDELSSSHERTTWSVLARLYGTGFLTDADLGEIYRRAQKRALAEAKSLPVKLREAGKSIE